MLFCSCLTCIFSGVPIFLFFVLVSMFHSFLRILVIPGWLSVYRFKAIKLIRSFGHKGTNGLTIRKWVSFLFFFKEQSSNICISRSFSLNKFIQRWLSQSLPSGRRLSPSILRSLRALPTLWRQPPRLVSYSPSLVPVNFTIFRLCFTLVSWLKFLSR